MIGPPVNNIGSYNTYLGYEAGQGQSTESNAMRLGARDNTMRYLHRGRLRHNRINGIPVLISPKGGLERDLLSAL